MRAVLLIAAPVLQAPADPGDRGLWGIVALVLLLGLVAAHVRVLRAVARQIDQAAADAQPDDERAAVGSR